MSARSVAMAHVTLMALSNVGVRGGFLSSIRLGDPATVDPMTLQRAKLSEFELELPAPIPLAKVALVTQDTFFHSSDAQLTDGMPQQPSTLGVLGDKSGKVGDDAKTKRDKVKDDGKKKKDKTAEDGKKSKDNAAADGKKKKDNTADDGKKSRDRAANDAERSSENAKRSGDKAAEDAKQSKDDADDDAKHSKDKAGDDLKKSVDKAKDDAKKAAQKAKEEAKKAADKAKEGKDGKDGAASWLAELINHTSGDLSGLLEALGPEAAGMLRHWGDLLACKLTGTCDQKDDDGSAFDPTNPATWALLGFLAVVLMVVCMTSVFAVRCMYAAGRKGKEMLSEALFPSTTPSAREPTIQMASSVQDGI